MYTVSGAFLHHASNHCSTHLISALIFHGKPLGMHSSLLCELDLTFAPRDVHVVRGCRLANVNQYSLTIVTGECRHDHIRGMGER